jgi:predicted nucleotidyltransferase
MPAQPETQTIISKAKEALSGYPVLFAYLFGSYSTGKTTERSDIDIAFFLDYSIPKSKYRAIKNEIEEALLKQLSMGFNQEAHTQILNDLYEKNIPLEHEIVYNGKLFYVKDDGARAHYEACAIRRACDWKPRQERFNKAILENINKPIEPYKIYA